MAGSEVIECPPPIKQIREDAKKALDAGLKYWPEVALQLCSELEKALKENARLRQMDLFAQRPPERR